MVQQVSLVRPVLLHTYEKDILESHDRDCRICHEELNADAVQTQCCERILHRECYRGWLKWKKDKLFLCMNCREPTDHYVTTLLTRFSASELVEVEHTVRSNLALVNTIAAIAFIDWAIRVLNAPDRGPISQQLIEELPINYVLRKTNPDQLDKMQLLLCHPVAPTYVLNWFFNLSEYDQHRIYEHSADVGEWLSLDLVGGQLFRPKLRWSPRDEPPSEATATTSSSSPAPNADKSDV